MWSRLFLRMDRNHFGWTRLYRKIAVTGPRLFVLTLWCQGKNGDFEKNKLYWRRCISSAKSISSRPDYIWIRFLIFEFNLLASFANLLSIAVTCHKAEFSVWTVLSKWPTCCIVLSPQRINFQIELSRLFTGCKFSRSHSTGSNIVKGLLMKILNPAKIILFQAFLNQEKRNWCNNASLSARDHPQTHAPSANRTCCIKLQLSS